MIDVLKSLFATKAPAVVHVETDPDGTQYYDGPDPALAAAQDQPTRFVDADSGLEMAWDAAKAPAAPKTKPAPVELPSEPETAPAVPPALDTQPIADDDEPVAPAPVGSDRYVMEAIAADQDVKQAVKLATNAVSEYEETCNAWSPILDTEGTIALLRAELGRAETPEAVAGIQSTIAKLTHPSNADAQQNAKRRISTAFVSVRPLLAGVSTAALRALDQLEQSTREAEAEFLASFDLPWSPTAASKRLQGIKAKLLNDLAAWTEPAPEQPMMSVFSPAPRSLRRFLSFYCRDL